MELVIGVILGGVIGLIVGAKIARVRVNRRKGYTKPRTRRMG